MKTLKTTMLAVGAALTLAGAGVAGAAPSAAQPAATHATCDALQKQAATALSTHKTDAKSKSAEKLRDEGSQACKAGDYAKGAEHLRRAITELGMKPVD